MPPPRARSWTEDVNTCILSWHCAKQEENGKGQFGSRLSSIQLRINVRVYGKSDYEFGN